jgi:DNA polymerase III epsilon subunit-like protein
LEAVQQEEVREIAWVIADTETTGLTGPACEVAFREICPDTLEVLGEIQSLIDPECEIEPGAQGVHGITQEMVAAAPTMDEFISTPGYLDGRFDGRDIVLIAHNASFDEKRLRKVGNIVSSVCTLFHARRLIPEAANHKLPTLREHFGFPKNEAHRAMADVATTHRLLKELMARAGRRTLRDFHATQETTIHRWTFGKYRGRLLMDTPKDYLEWFKKQPEVEPNLKASIVKVLKTMK